MEIAVRKYMAENSSSNNSALYTDEVYTVISVTKVNENAYSVKLLNFGEVKELL